MTYRRLFSFVLTLVMLFSFSACSQEERQEALEISEKENVKQIVEGENVAEAADKILNDMTLEEKVYQMMFVAPEDITGVGVALQAGETTKKALEEYPVGGIIYFAQNFESREQITKMIKSTQSYSRIPLFISVDEEGGRVSRLGSNPSMGTVKHPPMLEIGKTEDFEKAYETGKTLANDLKSLGFNMDFAPVADVLINKNNTEIGDRSFGNDTEIVSMMVENCVRGLQENGVSATLKHFPGAGATSVDSHTGYSANPRTAKELRSTEFQPFIAGIDAGADFVMISHMTLTNAIKENLPCSLSKEVVTDMLVNELGFKGIIITDSFRMGAVTEHYLPEEIGVMAIKAGNDMILMPKDMQATHKGIVDAVNTGEISEERINESVRKILQKKIEKDLWK